MLVPTAILSVRRAAAGRWAVLVTTLAAMLAAALAEGAEKAALPGPEALATAQRTLKATYGEELRALRSPTQRSVMAGVLLRKARTLPTKDPLRLALMQTARDLAVQAGDAVAALDVVDALRRDYAVDYAAVKGETLVRLAKISCQVKQFPRVVQELLELASDAARADDFPTVTQLTDAANVAARRSGNVDLQAQTKIQVQALAAKAALFATVQPSLETLKQEPLDNAANLAVGNYRCLAQGAWAEGLPLWLHSGDPALEAIARRDLDDPTAAADQLTLGDAWWDLAAKANGQVKERLQERAVTWYRQARPELDAATQKRIEQRIREAERGAP